MNLDRARELARSALAFLEASKQRINDLNVYPVPDGDTGTNLVATVSGIVGDLEASTAAEPRTVADDLRRAALMSAKGNSGVIFSQIVRGFADVLGEHDEIDGEVLARAFRSASDAAYRAVQVPVEGTMLTVIREMAEEAELTDVRALPKAALLERVIARGEDALARTPDMLQKLKEAGVVDAGGAGLVEIVKGLKAGIAGEPVPSAPVETEELGFEAVHQELSEYRYCTVFLIEGERLDRDAIHGELERLGDSLLVVGDETMVKVHVHTDEPGRALAVGTRAGVLESVEVANMHRQTAEREQRLSAGVDDLDALPTLDTGLVVVAAGAGNRGLFEASGATRVVDGGQTANPSTGDILAAIEATPATEVIVLPNNPNIQLAAEQAAAEASRRTLVLPTRSMQEGLEAMVAYDPARSADENVTEMSDAVETCVTGDVTCAVRDATVDGVVVREGAWFGRVEGRAVACDDDLDAVVDAVAAQLVADDQRSALTVIRADPAPPAAELLERLAGRHPRLEVQVLEGGQPHYPVLLSAV
jgi:hypothetical protein